MKISDYLLEGKPNAITCSHLCSLLGMDPREVSKAIETERRHGAPICASSGTNPGYYLAANKDEMQRYCSSLRRRSREIDKTRRACEATIEKLPELEAGI